mmetsp:Transcript_132357/g.423543  ORF Transcript_132357/g.423543 Transcript_132357/m.423543 type:complete len:248 (+) Transcript_132357:122-865(+)
MPLRPGPRLLLSAGRREPAAAQKSCSDHADARSHLWKHRDGMSVTTLSGPGGHCSVGASPRGALCTTAHGLQVDLSVRYPAEGQGRQGSVQAREHRVGHFVRQRHLGVVRLPEKGLWLPGEAEGQGHAPQHLEFRAALWAVVHLRQRKDQRRRLPDRGAIELELGAAEDGGRRPGGHGRRQHFVSEVHHRLPEVLRAVWQIHLQGPEAQVALHAQAEAHAVAHQVAAVDGKGESITEPPGGPICSAG